MSVAITITLNPTLYLRDPIETKLGKKIVKESILLIDKIGFECFNFKKLAESANCTEASVYRYFENKHNLLLYLVSWYWEWVGHLCDTNTKNIVDPREKLRIMIRAFVSASKENAAVPYVNESVLHRVVIAEGAKAYHTKNVDKENSSGVYMTYKSLVGKFSDVILAIDPNFPYPRALGTNLFEMANNHIFFAKHLPRLTDIQFAENNLEQLEKMLDYFAFGLLRD